MDVDSAAKKEKKKKGDKIRKGAVKEEEKIEQLRLKAELDELLSALDAVDCGEEAGRGVIEWFAKEMEEGMWEVSVEEVVREIGVGVLEGGGVSSLSAFDAGIPWWEAVRGTMKRYILIRTSFTRPCMAASHHSPRTVRSPTPRHFPRPMEGALWKFRLPLRASVAGRERFQYCYLPLNSSPTLFLIHPGQLLHLALSFVPPCLPLLTSCPPPPIGHLHLDSLSPGFNNLPPIHAPLFRPLKPIHRAVLPPTEMEGYRDGPLPR